MKCTRLLNVRYDIHESQFTAINIVSRLTNKTNHESGMPQMSTYVFERLKTHRFDLH